MLQTPLPELSPPLETLMALVPRTSVRVVTRNEVLVDDFLDVDLTVSPARVRLSGSQWQIDKIEAVAVADQLESPVRSRRIEPRGISKLFRRDLSWSNRICRPPQDLLIVGSVNRIRDDLNSYLSVDSEAYEAERLSDILLVETDGAATWSTRLMTTATFVDDLLSPLEATAAVLDGATAIKYVAEVTAPVVIAIVDRSVADESASEILLQLRASRGRPISSENELRWTPPEGIEILAFAVPL